MISIINKLPCSSLLPLSFLTGSSIVCKTACNKSFVNFKHSLSLLHFSRKFEQIAWSLLLFSMSLQNGFYFSIIAPIEKVYHHAIKLFELPVEDFNRTKILGFRATVYKQIWRLKMIKNFGLVSNFSRLSAHPEGIIFFEKYSDIKMNLSVKIRS
jgi:hypothetical protein